MASLTQIREALADTVSDNSDDLTGYPLAPARANLPAFVVLPRTTDFLATFARGFDTYELGCLVLVSRRDDGLAQNDLDEFITGAGVKSVRQILWSNKTLGLTDGTEATVVSVSDYGARFDVGDIDHVGARLLIRVTTPGTA